MIIILEGLNGTGKTTVAKALSDLLGAPIYKPFRRETDVHYTGENQRQLFLKNRLHLPINTHIEDLYIADFISVVRPRMILDRSLPSAIAYGLAEGDPLLPKQEDLDQLVRFWETLLLPASPLYVWMHAPYKVAQERCQGREWPLTPEKSKLLYQQFDCVYDKITMPKLAINTLHLNPKDAVNAIFNAVYQNMHVDIGD